jgi:hypothetical protein
MVAVIQVASQQGDYLARCFNRMPICEQNPEGPIRIRGEGRHRFQPFRYVFTWFSMSNSSDICRTVTRTIFLIFMLSQ